MKTVKELLKEWHKELRKQQFLEDGAIAELEDHLLNEMEQLQSQGYTEQQAFEKAKASMGNIHTIANNERASLRRQESNFRALFSNVLKVASRYYVKNKLTSTINMGGLVVAFVSVIFIGLFIYDELTFEKHHPDYERINRLSYSRQLESGDQEDVAYSSGMWVDLLKERHSAIEDIFRFVNISYGYIQNPSNNESFYTEDIYWSDPNFFDFLKFKLKYGTKEDQLKSLNSIVLTEKSAMKIFGKENPIGESLKFVRRSNEINLTVTGVLYDPPSNSQFQPHYVAHLQAVQTIYGEDWRGWVDKNPNPGYVYSYIKLKDQNQSDEVASAMADIWQEAIPDIAKDITPLITPIKDIHFKKPVRSEIDTPIDLNVIYGLIIIGFFILVIVLTNFTNLITAQASKRKKEIGLRTTLGSSKKQLEFQFFVESVVMVITSIFISLVFVYFLMPSFNRLINKNLDFFEVIAAVDFVLVMVAIFFFVILFAGMLPAFYFTKGIKNFFNVNDFFLREKVNSPTRNALVIAQFTVAIVLVISTMTIYKQLAMINSSALGKNREAVLGIRTSRMGNANQANLMKTRLESLAGIEANTLGMHLPRQSDFGRIDTKFVDQTSGKALFWNKFDADGGFLSTYDLELIAGRDFNRNLEEGALIINESALKELGLTAEAAIGVSLREDSISYAFGSSHGVVVGVVKDFVYKSIKEAIEPLVICANNDVGGVLSLKLAVGNKSLIIAEVEKIWAEVYPNRPFEYWFLDKEFERMYSQERRLGKLIPLFSSLTIIIAMLGLFALTLFISELRKKEIGIRKILGCSSSGILRMLGWQFLKTLIPAIIIAVPLAYLGLNNWLNAFRYRVEVSFGIILGSVLVIVLFSILTISYRSILAARRNPVENLKYE